MLGFYAHDENFYTFSAKCPDGTLVYVNNNSELRTFFLRVWRRDLFFPTSKNLHRKSQKIRKTILTCPGIAAGAHDRPIFQKTLDLNPEIAFLR